MNVDKCTERQSPLSSVRIVAAGVWHAALQRRSLTIETDCLILMAEGRSCRARLVRVAQALRDIAVFSLLQPPHEFQIGTCGE